MWWRLGRFGGRIGYTAVRTPFCQGTQKVSNKTSRNGTPRAHHGATPRHRRTIRPPCSPHRRGADSAVKAAIYREYRGAVLVEELPDPEPAPDGVVLRVEANGICRSDWHGWVGHDPDIVLPHVPGHEIAGVVEEVGREVTRWRPGDRVSVPFIAGVRTLHALPRGQPAGVQQAVPARLPRLGRLRRTGGPATGGPDTGRAARPDRLRRGREPRVPLRDLVSRGTGAGQGHRRRLGGDPRLRRRGSRGRDDRARARGPGRRGRHPRRGARDGPRSRCSRRGERLRVSGRGRRGARDHGGAAPTPPSTRWATRTPASTRSPV